MATSRVRKAFRYPDDNDNEPLELDEEQQEKLIADLQRQDTDNTKLYRSIFPVIPAGAALFAFATIFTASNAQQRLKALLSLSSLVATTYLFIVFPLRVPDREGKRPVYQAALEQSPVANHLPRLNAALAAVLLISAIASYGRGQIDRAMQEALPIVTLGITLFVRVQLRPLDWDKLHQARYELKGA